MIQESAIDALIERVESKLAGEKPAKLTQKIAREYVEMLGGKLKRYVEADEYCVRFGTGDKEESHLALNLADAIQTARCMAGGHQNFPDAERFLAECGVNLEVSL